MEEKLAQQAKHHGAQAGDSRPEGFGNRDSFGGFYTELVEVFLLKKSDE